MEEYDFYLCPFEELARILAEHHGGNVAAFAGFLKNGKCNKFTDL